MNDDTLLTALAGEARKQKAADQLDPRWERYAEGTLSDGELTDLVASVTAEEATALKAAFAPLGESFQQQISERIQTELAAIDKLSTDVKQETESDSKVVNFEARNRKVFAPIAFAATVLLAFGLWQFGSGQSGFSDAVQSSLPGYELSLLGGSTFRSGAPAELPEFTGGDRLELRLVPATATQQPMEARLYAKTAAGFERAEQAIISIAPSGAVRITGRLGTELELVQGSTSLLVVIGLEGSLPELGQLFETLEKKEVVVGSDWQAWRVPVRVVP